MRYWALVVGVSLLLSVSFAFAQEDAEGCKDSPLIQRMPGSTISTCEHKEFDSVEMPVGKNADGDPVTKNIEGEVWSWSMGNREGLSDVQVYRNFLNALQKANWTIDFQSPNGQITAHKGSDCVFMDNMNASFYYQTIVHLKEMKQEVVADAATMDNEIKQNGHVAVYGIHFNTGKADILHDSESTLNEIVKLMQQDTALKLRVEGHTDNQGSAGLAAKGFGQTKPVADNSTEDGRAKNRRVELARQ